MAGALADNAILTGGGAVTEVRDKVESVAEDGHLLVNLALVKGLAGCAVSIGCGVLTVLVFHPPIPFGGSHPVTVNEAFIGAILAYPATILYGSRGLAHVRRGRELLDSVGLRSTKGFFAMLLGVLGILPGTPLLAFAVVLSSRLWWPLS